MVEIAATSNKKIESFSIKPISFNIKFDLKIEEIKGRDWRLSIDQAGPYPARSHRKASGGWVVSTGGCVVSGSVSTQEMIG